MRQGKMILYGCPETIRPTATFGDTFGEKKGKMRAAFKVTAATMQAGTFTGLRTWTAGLFSQTLFRLTNGFRHLLR
ncbi:hypothetical protein ACFOGG_18850 [Brenneria rubrifaciens]|uniref:hypothetical protein n=1 Tax=Brenneria rubrifaciens TaxID=55213 RepID=UPI00360A68E4